MSGNPVKIRDGCATVTATNSQEPPKRIGKAGRRSEAEVRIPVWLCSSRSSQRRSMTVATMADFSVKEKDEASLANCFRQDSLDAFILRFAGVWRFFYFQPPSHSALVSQS